MYSFSNSKLFKTFNPYYLCLKYNLKFFSHLILFKMLYFIFVECKYYMQLFSVYIIVKTQCIDNGLPFVDFL